jgi:hypothetical protein
LITSIGKSTENPCVAGSIPAGLSCVVPIVWNEAGSHHQKKILEIFEVFFDARQKYKDKNQKKYEMSLNLLPQTVHFRLTLNTALIAL